MQRLLLDFAQLANERLSQIALLLNNCDAGTPSESCADSQGLMLYQQLERSVPAGWIARTMEAGPFAWTYILRPSHQICQGWKIHVSCSGYEFANCWLIVSEYCFGNDLPFKFPANSRGIEMLNSGLAGDLQIGKIFTVYTSSADPPLRHLDDLHNRLPIQSGPIVPSDLRLHTESAVSCRCLLYTSRWPND